MSEKLPSATKESTTVHVFRSEDGRVYVQVVRDGKQLAHLRAGDSFVIPTAVSETGAKFPDLLNYVRGLNKAARKDFQRDLVTALDYCREKRDD